MTSSALMVQCSLTQIGEISRLYDFVGHQLKVTDYEYGELLTVEDFGLTSALQIYSTIENGYTKIWAQTEWGDYHPIKLEGEFSIWCCFRTGHRVEQRRC